MDAIRVFQGNSIAGWQTAGLNVRSAIQSALQLLLAVLFGVLHPGLSHAAFYAGVAGPDDISALRTPWYYIPENPLGAACLKSEQEAMAPVLAGYRSLACESRCRCQYLG